MPDLGSSATATSIDLAEDSLALRNYTSCFKVGTTYYARKHDGSLISSGTTAETVLAAALANEGTIFLANNQSDAGGTNWDLSAGFTGFTISDTTTLFAPDHLVRIKPPNGYTGTVFTIDGPVDTGVNMHGFEIREQGTSANDWTGIKLQMNGATDYAYFCKFSDIHIVNPNIGIELETGNSSAFITSCSFENILIWHPVTAGVLWDEITGGQISDNMFKDVNIQTDANTVHGFKNVSGNFSTFINCAVWDSAATTVDMNIASGATGNYILGCRFGDTGSFIDQGTQTTLISGAKNGGPRNNQNTTPDLNKYGSYYGIAPSVGEGMFNGRIAAIASGTASDAGGADSTGTYRTFSTGATNSSETGIHCNNGAFRRILNAYFKAAIYLNNNTNVRVFCGMVSDNAAPAGGADPLNAKSGIGLWFDSAVSANWKRMHNDSSGASVVDDTSVAAATATLYPIEIYGMSDSKFRFVFNGTHTDISSDIPASTVNLACWVYMENTTGSDRSFRVYYIIMRQDK